MIKPYYSEPGITIYHGDCLSILPKLPDKSVDLILTDPPYGLNYNNGDLASRTEAAFGGNKTRMKPRPIQGDDEEKANETFKSFMVESARILKPCGCCCCCGGGGGPKPLFARWTLWMDETPQMHFKQAVVWNKGGLGMGIHYRRNYEFILVAQKDGNGACIWNGGKTTSNIFNIPKIIPQEEEHPTAKPIELMEHFIHLHSNKENIVIDPFFGHGTTLVAAKRLGRKAIGIEICKDYCRIAVKRLQQEVLPL